jgi:DNA (cytosine-5)-methyltransferase 1
LNKESLNNKTEGKNNVDTTITTLEFCTGYGGIGLGLKNIFGERMRTIAYCELEGFAQANIISKMEKGLMDVAPIWNDLKTFPYESFHGLVDIFIAGYPCQPFSAAGKRAGKDDPRHLWPWIADGVRLLRPRMCFFENVEGHISLGLREVIGDLESIGYKAAWGIFSAAEVGAPHQRKRVFILAHLVGAGLQGFSRDEYGHSQGEGSFHESTSSNGLFNRSIWPSRPGKPQYDWEPPRVLANTKFIGRSGGRDGDAGGLCGEIQTAGSCGGTAKSWQVKSTLGRDTDGTSGGMGYAELSVSCDNRTDELRLLGNGVVPETAERAFRVLIEELKTT